MEPIVEYPNEWGVKSSDEPKQCRAGGREEGGYCNLRSEHGGPHRFADPLPELEVPPAAITEIEYICPESSRRTKIKKDFTISADKLDLSIENRNPAVYIVVNDCPRCSFIHILPVKPVGG